MEILSDDILYLILRKYLEKCNCVQIKKLIKIPYPHLVNILKFNDDIKRLFNRPTIIMRKYMSNIRRTSIGYMDWNKWRSGKKYRWPLNYDLSSYWNDKNVNNITSLYTICELPNHQFLDWYNLHVNGHHGILSSITIEGEDITKVSIKTLPDIEIYRRYFLKNKLITICPSVAGLITHGHHNWMEFYMKVIAKNVKHVWCKYIWVKPVDRQRMEQRLEMPHIFYDKKNHRITTKLVYDGYYRCWLEE
ncbi:Uncharacterised protein [uncultured archaeon]|nr:Uncharacterised protein [uncultured archaeon]